MVEEDEIVRSSGCDEVVVEERVGEEVLKKKIKMLIKVILFLFFKN